MSDQRDGGIAWTDATWNPVRGCSRISEGCRHCYAEKVAARFCGPGAIVGGDGAGGGFRQGKPGPYNGLVRDGKWNGKVRLVPEHLHDPLRWRRPRKVFVNSMSDLFHEALPDSAIDEVLAVMLLAPRHVFQTLTKRAARMRAYLAAPDLYKRVLAVADRLRVTFLEATSIGVSNPGVRLPPWIWLGVSVEDQRAADEHIPHLLATPAAVRWVSYEPAIGPIDFTRFLRYHPSHEHHQEHGGVDLRSGETRGDGDRLPGSDLAHGQARMGSVAPLRSDERVPPGASRDPRPEERVPFGEGNDRQAPSDRDGSPPGVEALQRTSAGGDDDQPQERSQRRQPTGEPGACDEIGEHQARGPRAPRRTYGPPERDAQPRSEADSGAGDGDPRATGERREVGTAGGRVRSGDADDLTHRAWRSAHLWIVVGGESGPKARPFDLAWARDTVRACREAAVPCFVKQIGRHPIDPSNGVGAMAFPGDREGREMHRWDPDIRVREWPRSEAP